ncbi:MAG: Phosphoglucosamine mutase [Methanobacterium sp. PtaU1.Bin242]|nr:MAG: Phosphoglucosamine mutase [Methanobacterium sp. PtaU1.Bin242]
MEKVEEEFPQLFADVVEANLIDGVRISMEDGSWILIRPSGTEPYIRITLGGRTTGEAGNLMKKSKKFMGGLL